MPDQGCDNSRSSHSLSLAVQYLLVYRLILSPCILTTQKEGQVFPPPLLSLFVLPPRPVMTDRWYQTQKTKHAIQIDTSTVNYGWWSCSRLDLNKAVNLFARAPNELCRY